MKSLFHPKRLAQIVLGLAALTFTQCNKPETAASSTTAAPGANTAPTNSVGIISEGASPGFRAVASRLELGGRSYEYSESDGAMAIAALLDEILKALPASERKDIPAGFTVVKLFQLLGFDSITANGSSSRSRADGSFHSRSFAYMPQGRKGLLTLSGGPAAKLLLLDLAPKDTDLVLEFPINLKDFARDGLPGVLAMIPPAERADFEKEMSRPIPLLGLTGKQIIEKLDARIGLFLRLDPTQKFQPSPSAPVMPGMDGVIAIERLGWLIEALKPQFMPMLSQPGGPVAVTDEGGVLTLRFTRPAGPPPMDYQPVLRFDPKADRIVIATRPALFESVLAGQEKIAQGADFSKAWRDLPNEGNASIYASPRLLQTISDLIAKSAQTPANSPMDTAVMRKMFDMLKPILSSGQAAVFVNQPDGTLTLINSSIPFGSSSMTTVATVSMLAAIAVPNFVRARERALSAHELNTLRQVQIALKTYAAENGGKYPAELSTLVPKYLSSAALIEHTDRHTNQHSPWLYRNSLNYDSPAGEALIASPVASSLGERAVGFNDGSVSIIPEPKFQSLWGRK